MRAAANRRFRTKLDRRSTDYGRFLEEGPPFTDNTPAKRVSANRIPLWICSDAFPEYKRIQQFPKGRLFADWQAVLQSLGQGPRRVTVFFAFSVTGATLLVGWLVWAAADAGAGAFQHAALSLLAALALLGFLEHWFLVLPLRETALWRWAMRAAGERSPREHRTGRTPVPGQRDVFDRTGALNRAGGVASPPGNGRVQ